MKKQAKRILKPQLIHWRLLVVVSFVCLLFISLIARAAYIQVLEPERLRHESDMRTLRTTSNEVQRGMITDRNGEVLAVSVPVRAVYADPKVVHNRGGFSDMRRWQALAEVLHEPKDKLVERVKSNPKKRFVYIKRQVTPVIANYIKQLKIPGIYLKPESRRYYPTSEITAQLIGLTNIDGKGIEGIEKTYNSWLTGTPSKHRVRKSRDGQVVERLGIIEKGESPNDLVLSIDQRLQQLAYRELKRATEMNQATSGSLVMLDVKTGEVLAIVNTPSYNPNSREQLQSYRMRNRSLTDSYEPGSTVKPFVVVAALENGVVKPDDIVDTSPGWMRVGGKRVRDSRNYGEMSLGKVLKKSSNVGISKLALEIPVQQLIGTYQSLGIGNYSGINLAGESSGVLHERNRWSDFERATLSFGYGLTVTPLQLARMYAALGNNGVLYPTSIFKLKTPPQGEQVIDPEIAKEVTQMLVGVTEKGGTGTKAYIDGYPVAGKSGTSRKAVSGGYGNEYVGLFVGIAPANDPRVAMVVVINEPKGDRYYGGDVAAPVFSRVMSSTLQLLNIEPERKQVKEPELDLAKRSDP